MIEAFDLKFLSISDSHEIIYKGVNLGITRENISDYQINSGFDGTEWVMNVYVL